MTTTSLWLIAGVALLAFEAMAVPGAGLMFAGIGALITGIALQMGWIAEDATLLQFIICSIGATISAVLLWKPMQKLRLGNHKNHYHNMVGDTAYVGSAGVTKRDGEATWSGTIMKARLAESASVDKLEAGTQVSIAEVQGTTLIVVPKE